MKARDLCVARRDKMVRMAERCGRISQLARQLASGDGQFEQRRASIEELAKENHVDASETPNEVVRAMDGSRGILNLVVSLKSSDASHIFSRIEALAEKMRRDAEGTAAIYQGELDDLDVPIMLRAATDDDVHALVDLDKILFDASGDPADEVLWAAQIECIVVATWKSRVVGCAVVDKTHLQLLAVAPAFQRRGIGTTLLEDALARGVRTLNVRQDNAGARALYRKHGFQECLNDNHGLLMMTLRKSPPARKPAMNARHPR